MIPTWPTVLKGVFIRSVAASHFIVAKASAFPIYRINGVCLSRGMFVPVQFHGWEMLDITARHNDREASQINGLAFICSNVCLGGDQRKRQSSASLAFVRIHRWPVNSQHKEPVTRKKFPFHDVIMKHKYDMFYKKMQHYNDWFVCFGNRIIRIVIVWYNTNHMDLSTLRDVICPWIGYLNKKCSIILWTSQPA